MGKKAATRSITKKKRLSRDSPKANRVGKRSKDVSDDVKEADVDAEQEPQTSDVKTEEVPIRSIRGNHKKLRLSFENVPFVNRPETSGDQSDDFTTFNQPRNKASTTTGRLKKLSDIQLELFQEQCKLTDEYFAKDKLKTYNRLFDTIADFIHSPESWRNFGQTENSLTSSLIPTAVLSLNFCGSGDSVLDDLQKELEQYHTSVVIRLRSDACQHLSRTIAMVVRTLLKVLSLMTSDDVATSSSGISTLRQLYRWYCSQTGSWTESRPGPFVLLVEDLTGIDRKVVDGLVSICAEYIDRLPFAFVFGVATAGAATVQRVFSHQAYRSFRLKEFVFPSPIRHLTAAVTGLFNRDTVNFRLTGSLLKLLVKRYSNETYSIPDFVKGIKLALLEFFLEEPSSALCTTDVDKHKHLDNIGPVLLKQLLQQQGTDTENSDGNSDEDVVFTAIDRINCHNMAFLPLMRVLRCLLKGLPRDLPELQLYIKLLSTNIFKDGDDTVDDWVGLWQTWSKETLLERVNDCLTVLRDGGSGAYTADVHDLFSKYRDQLMTVDERQVAEDAKRSQEGRLFRSIEAVGGVSTAPAKGKRVTMQQMQEQQRRRVVEHRTHNLFVRERIRFIADLKLIFADGFKSPNELFCNKAFYVRDTANVSRRLFANSARSIDVGLMEPMKYATDCDQFMKEGSTIDSAAAYQAVSHLGGSAKAVKLVDWMQQFCRNLGFDTDEEIEGCLNDPSLVARFYAVAGELELIGVVKVTNDKNIKAVQLIYQAPERRLLNELF